MSMNIHLYAKIEAEIVIKGKKLPKIIYEKFNCRQTPTEITKNILKSNNPYKEYCDWIRRMSDSVPLEEIFVYEEDDYFEEKEPIDIIYRNNEDIHIKELNEFISNHTDWELKWYEL